MKTILQQLQSAIDKRSNEIYVYENYDITDCLDDFDHGYQAAIINHLKDLRKTQTLEKRLYRVLLAEQKDNSFLRSYSAALGNRIWELELAAYRVMCESKPTVDKNVK